jgi:uridine kinase
MAASPFVVAVSGTSGSGKTTLVQGLAAALADVGPRVVRLHFDQYSAVSDVPDDLASWVQRGADPDEWRTDRFVDDLERHVREDPGPHGTVLLVEEPFGRARTPFRAIVDLAVHIHLPLGVSLARRLLRDFVPDLVGPSTDGPDRLRAYLDTYLNGGGAAYEAIEEVARTASDVVLDGLADRQELVEKARREVVLRLSTRTEAPPSTR